MTPPLQPHVASTFSTVLKIVFLIESNYDPELPGGCIIILPLVGMVSALWLTARNRTWPGTRQLTVTRGRRGVDAHRLEGESVWAVPSRVSTVYSKVAPQWPVFILIGVGNLHPL